MTESLNRDFLALQGTIISCCGYPDALTIPTRQDGMPITAIGKGAFGEIPTLKRVNIPREIRRIGREAFIGCGKLETVTFTGPLPELGDDLFIHCPELKRISLFRLPVSGEQYRQLRDNSCRLTDGRLTPLRFPDWAGLDRLGSSLDTRPFVQIPAAVDCLFQDWDLALTMHESDRRRFQELIRRGFETPRNPTAEEENDRCARRERVPQLNPVALVCVDDRETVRGEETALLRVDLLIGRFYWQSKVEIAYEGQTHYLYQRNYLSGKPKMEYIRRNMCVFTGETPLEDERRAGEIYAKYQLSTLL